MTHFCKGRCKEISTKYEYKCYTYLRRCIVCKVYFKKNKVGKFCSCCGTQLKWTTRSPSLRQNNYKWSEKIDMGWI